MMLRTVNAAGTHIYPMYQNGQLDAAHLDKNALTVFVPDGGLEGADWACTIENAEGAVVIHSLEEMAKLITALEIAFEHAKQVPGLSV